MKMHRTFAAVGLILMSGATWTGAHAGERPGMGGGPVQRILDASKELGLTDDQKTKLQALAKEFAAGHDPAAMREKFKNNPAMLEVLKEMKAARESGDQAKLKELRAKLAAAAGEGGGKGAELIQKISQILTPEQLKKLKEMRENAGEKRGGAKDTGADKNNKPDPSKGVPVPF